MSCWLVAFIPYACSHHTFTLLCLQLFFNLQAAVADIGEEWLYEHFDGRAKNIKFTTLHPGSMLSDLARKSVPGELRMSALY